MARLQTQVNDISATSREGKNFKEETECLYSQRRNGNESLHEKVSTSHRLTPTTHARGMGQDASYINQEIVQPDCKSKWPLSEELEKAQVDSKY